jgi:hypothetical protein
MPIDDPGCSRGNFKPPYPTTNKRVPPPKKHIARVPAGSAGGRYMGLAGGGWEPVFGAPPTVTTRKQHCEIIDLSVKDRRFRWCGDFKDITSRRNYGKSRVNQSGSIGPRMAKMFEPLHPAIKINGPGFRYWAWATDSKESMQQFATWPFMDICGRAEAIMARTKLENEIYLFKRAASTARQASIIDLAIRGLGPAEIGKKLNIDRTTVWREFTTMKKRIEKDHPETVGPIPAFLKALDDADVAHVITSTILGHYGAFNGRDQFKLAEDIKEGARAAGPGRDVG